MPWQIRLLNSIIFMDCNNIDSIECRTDFLDRVSKYLTVNCQLPFNVPQENINLITDEAIKYFVNNYDDFSEEIYLTIPAWVFRTEKFRTGLLNKTGIEDGGENKPESIAASETLKNRGIVVMPESVFSVMRVYQLNRFAGESGYFPGSLNGPNPEFGTQRMLFSTAYSSGLAQGADNMIFYVYTMGYFDTMRQILQPMNSFSYNRRNHKLRFTGELPVYDVVIHCINTIDDCDMYEDDLFFRYVCGMCMKNLSRILSTFQYTLPGGVSINTSTYDSFGESEITAVKEEIDKRRSVAYFYTS